MNEIKEYCQINERLREFVGIINISNLGILKILRRILGIENTNFKCFHMYIIRNSLYIGVVFPNNTFRCLQIDQNDLRKFFNGSIPSDLEKQLERYNIPPVDIPELEARKVINYVFIRSRIYI